MILVVEDEPGVRALIERILTRNGYDVTSVPNAPDALELLATTRGVTLIVTDIVMPGMKGTEMVRLMRPEHDKLPVLFVTGYPDDEDLQLGPNERLLLKPFSQMDLLEQVEDAFAREPE